MPKSDRQLTDILISQLTTSEQAHGVAYVCSTMFVKGTTISFPHLEIDVPWDAYLAFIDGDPAANWGHACRYVLLNPETGDTLSREARFPPFQRGATDWQIAYRAPGIPDGILPIPDK
ncbi:hypothetical protein LMG29739_01751 [Paraburkholderia solisilvae]|uniref:Uncharacterized protein n=2 Tax=Paraburkholderia solisilvae TaxID=624376 RepID=A0A6J5DKW3_9BURK|nr:hypothetical protein LMG29739_01751 [Paraburkholderia solisilvae]